MDLKLKNKTVFVSGHFNVVHPGHLRVLRFAKECGDYLIIGSSETGSGNAGSGKVYIFQKNLGGT